MNSLRELLKGLTKASKVTNKNISKDIGRLLNKVETGIPSVDTFFHTTTITRSSSGLILINDVPANQVRDFLRKGDLIGLLRVLKSPIIITTEQADIFRKIVSDFPEVKLAELDESIRKLKRAWPDLA